MEPFTNVLIHESRYPGRARAAYIESFRSRRMNHQFHYDTEKHAQLWLALHEAYSPARRDEDVLRMYQEAFQIIARDYEGMPLSIVSLGCGGGQKDIAFLSEFSGLSKVTYVPTDVSLALALTAHFAATSKFPSLKSQPAVLDLKAAVDLERFFAPGSLRLILLFGILPNFEPEEILPQVSRALNPFDHVLVSANLAPGGDVQRILPQYDNPLTRRWLATVLIDAGLDVDPNDLEFKVGPRMRIEAGYHFRKRQTIQLDGEKITYEPGEWFQLFFSYRHTRDSIRALFRNHTLQNSMSRASNSEEEGLFLFLKGQPHPH